MRPKLESAECSGERTAHALRTSPKILDHHMPTHDIRRADVEHRWTRARSSSSHAGHDYRLHHCGDGVECVPSFDASWPCLTAGRAPRTARHRRCGHFHGRRMLLKLARGFRSMRLLQSMWLRRSVGLDSTSAPTSVEPGADVT